MRFRVARAWMAGDEIIHFCNSKPFYYNRSVFNLVSSEPPPTSRRIVTGKTWHMQIMDEIPARG